MPQIEGTVKPKTFACPKCGAFLWNEGICDPCQGNPVEAEVPEETVTYAYEDTKGKVVAKKRAKKGD